MSIRTFATALAAAVVFAASAVVVDASQAQSQGQAQAKPEAKPDAKADASLAGKWSVSVQSPNGAVDSALDLKLDGKKVAGTISSQLGESKIEGELAEGKLTFWFTMDMNGQALNLTFTGTQQKDGTLAGTLSLAGQGEMTWTGTRAK